MDEAPRGADPDLPLRGLPQPGELIADRYMVEEIIGQGGMGVVVAARHLALDQAVAIKILDPQKQDDATAFERFSREARIVASVTNEHIVAIRDYGMHGRSPFMVMDLLHGRDLRRELEDRGPLPIAEAVDHVIAACVGLAAAHAKGIVHRDIKPANLFLATNRVDGVRTLKIVDFGVAKVLDDSEIDLTRTNAAVGSPSYMSPEQIRDARSADARSDVWSLGVCLFKLVTGSVPFAATSATAMYGAILADPPKPLREFLPDAPAALESILLRCMDKDRSARFRDVETLAAALAPFASNEGRALANPLHREEPAAASAIDRPRSRRFVWGWVGTVVVAGSLVGAYLVARASHHDAPGPEPTARLEPSVVPSVTTSVATTAIALPTSSVSAVAPSSSAPAAERASATHVVRHPPLPSTSNASRAPPPAVSSSARFGGGILGSHY